MTKGDGWEAHEVKLPDKMVAMQMVCRMCGWEKPTKFSLSGDDTLSTYLLELRRQPIGGLPAPDSAKPVNGTVLPAYFRHTKAELWVEWRREPLAHRQF